MKRIRAAIWSLAILLLAFLTWMAFVGNHALDEMMLGVACAGFTAITSLLTWKAMDLSIAFRFRDVLQLWRLPWNILQDSWTITVALFRDLLHIQPVEARFVAVPFEEHRGRVGRLRHVLAVAYTSVSPNSIAIGIDDPHQLLLLHQLVPAPVSTVTRRLGARA